MMGSTIEVRNYEVTSAVTLLRPGRLVLGWSRVELQCQWLPVPSASVAPPAALLGLRISVGFPGLGLLEVQAQLGHWHGLRAISGCPPSGGALLLASLRGSDPDAAAPSSDVQ